MSRCSGSGAILRLLSGDKLFISLIIEDDAAIRQESNGMLQGEIVPRIELVIKVLKLQI